MSYNASSPLDEIKRIFRQKSILSTLILINAVVWLLVKIIQVLFYLFNHPDVAIADDWITHYFALPAAMPALVARPWTFLTYMFLHIDFWHILFNMLWLFWFGKIFLEFLTSRELVITYLAGGLAGGLLYVCAFNIFPVFRDILPVSVALGASASVMAIVIATSFYVPNYSVQLLFIGRIKIIYLALALFIIDFFAIPSGNAGGHIAHIGGALWGFIYVLLIRQGFGKQVFRFPDNLTKGIKNFFRFNKLHMSSRNPEYKRPVTDDEYNFNKNLQQKKIDKILDKIAKGGYDTLTREEKEFLFKSSGKNN
jgi:membrane associated rhomboid family serine protease